MGRRTNIEWTDATWTPIRARNRTTGKIGWHCERVSPGCEHCYSEAVNAQRLGTRLLFKPGHRADVELYLDEAMLLAPLRWARPRRIFVCSMTDLFGEFVPDAMIDRVFAVMALAPQHTFQVLTKRSARMRAYCCDPKTPARVALQRARMETRADSPPPIFIQVNVQSERSRWPHRNIWLGVSTEDQRRADERVPDLLATPAAVRFVSAEPLLGPIDFRMIAADDTGEIDALDGLSFCQGRNEPARLARIDQIIIGGESGPGARPTHPAWVRAICNQGAAAGTAFFFKQWGAWAVTRPEAGGDLGGDMRADRVRIAKLQGESDGHFRNGDVLMRRVGKRAAGRLLDGVEHNGMPGGQS